MTNAHTFQMAQQMEEAFNLVGHSMMKEDFAAKLLAYTYVCGGGNEAVVLHRGLNAGIGIAAQKFKIKGGEVPDAAGVVLIQKYIKELETKEKELGYVDFTKDPVKHVPWLREIFERYDLRWKEGFSHVKNKKEKKQHGTGTGDADGEE